jgi:hypothetical protein
MNPQAKAKGGKVRTVMHEFGQGKLRSSSGQKVTNPKQAIAIALSEQRRVKKMQEGGMTDEERAEKHRREWDQMTSTKTPVPPKEVERVKKKKADERPVPPTTTRDTMREKLFARGGIASNPRFDKTIGADRKMGADYVSADRKQKRFMSGTSTQAKVNRQDTRHGKIDMPFSQLNKYAGMREGGNVMKAKMEMRHAKAMKKAGLPKKMVREEMAEAKKYARGGGIESRGKTKGTVIRMASGGSVRGDGCAQRGKTKGKMV